MSVYLLCIDPPLHHARHYCGWTSDEDVSRRVREHTDCLQSGSPLVRAAIQAGCRVRIARTWTGPDADRRLERRIKNLHGTRVCPLCKGQGELPLEAGR